MGVTTCSRERGGKDAGEKGGELGGLRDEDLDDEAALLRVEPDGQPVEGDLPD